MFTQAIVGLIGYGYLPGILVRVPNVFCFDVSCCKSQLCKLVPTMLHVLWNLEFLDIPSRGCQHGRKPSHMFLDNHPR